MTDYFKLAQDICYPQNAVNTNGYVDIHCCICNQIVGDIHTFIKLDREGLVEDEISPVCDRCAENSAMLQGYEDEDLI